MRTLQPKQIPTHLPCSAARAAKYAASAWTDLATSGSRAAYFSAAAGGHEYRTLTNCATLLFAITINCIGFVALPLASFPAGIRSVYATLYFPLMRRQPGGLVHPYCLARLRPSVSNVAPKS